LFHNFRMCLPETWDHSQLLRTMYGHNLYHRDRNGAPATSPWKNAGRDAKESHRGAPAGSPASAAAVASSQLAPIDACFYRRPLLPRIGCKDRGYPCSKKALLLTVLVKWTDGKEVVSINLRAEAKRLPLSYPVRVGDRGRRVGTHLRLPA
jgi:hypothetical protein